MVYKRRKTTTWIACLLLSVWILVLLSVNGSVQGVRYEQDTRYFADAAGGFYKAVYDADIYAVYMIRSDGSVHEELRESMHVEAVSADNNRLTAAASLGTGKGIIRYCADSGRKNVTMIHRSDGNVTAVCADSRNHIWLADADNAEVREYDSSGRELKCCSTGTAVTALLTDAAGNCVYAAEEDGTLRELNDNKVWQGILCAGGFEQNGDYLCCEGNIYCLAGANGLTEIFSSDYPLVCRTNQCVYASDGSSVYRLTEDGSVDAVCDTGTSVQRLMASGNTVAYVSEEELTIITPSMMKRQASQYDSPYPSAVTGSDTQPDLSALDMVDERTIEVPQGTTVSNLKKQIRYAGWSLTVRNHHGSIVSAGTIGTGWELSFSRNGQEQRYITLVMGDLTGEGSVNNRDSTCLADYLVEAAELEPLQMAAADMNRNGCIEFNDFVCLYDCDR